MMRFALVVVAVLALPLAACNNAPPEQSSGDYMQDLLRARQAQDDLFRNRPNNPVPPDRVNDLIPLSYFPPDPEYVVPAVLKLAPERDVIDMPTSTGEMRKEERVGVLEFTLKGQQLSLAAFHEVGTDTSHLFVPFRDLTSGKESYPAGRYLDLDRTPTGIYNIDFNRAYNPYCYYNSRFDCPYPPAENKLPVAIRAGERMRPAGH